LSKMLDPTSFSTSLFDTVASIPKTNRSFPMAGRPVVGGVKRTEN
jgi:hypothetical protein